MFNLFSVAQQIYMNNFAKNRPTLETLKQAPKKEGWFQRKMREAQEMAEAQGKSFPGKASKSYSNYKGNKRKPKKRR